MPREFTHWKIAENIIANLKDTYFYESCTRYKNLVLLGSNFHDVLFYTTKIKSDNAINVIPNILHGSKGEDTYSIVKYMVDTINQKKENAHLIAFLVGIISHIHTDSVFHPMVFYFAGHYSKEKLMQKANQKHHKLESLIDLYYCSEMIKDDSYSLMKFLEKPGYPLGRLFSEAFTSFFKADISKIISALFSGYKTLAIQQKLAMNRIINVMLVPLELLLPNRLKDITSIRYDRKLLKYSSFIEGTLTYNNPVTGEKLNTNFDILYKQAIDNGISFCLKLEEFLKTRKPLELDTCGPSLKSGIPNAPVTQMKYFYKEKLFGI